MEQKKVGCCGLLLITVLIALVFNVAFLPALLVIAIVLKLLGRL